MQHFIKKLEVFSMTLPGLILLLFTSGVEVQAANDMKSLAGEFNGNANSFQKRQILRAAGEQATGDKACPNDKKIFESMIKTGLGDQHASIVGEAVYATGVSKNQEFVPDLIDLYHN